MIVLARPTERRSRSEHPAIGYLCQRARAFNFSNNRIRPRSAPRSRRALGVAVGGVDEIYFRRQLLANAAIAASRVGSWPCVNSRVLALNRFDVMYPAAIPLRAEPAATRCGEMVE